MNFTLPDQKAHHCEHEASQSESSAGRRSGPTANDGQLALSEQEQYLADLEVIARCELQIEHDAGCPDFFGCMGRLARGRLHG